MKHSYHIQGMTCKGCSRHVEKILSKVDGVSDAIINLEEKDVTIETESHISLKTFQDALQKDGGRYSIHKLGEHHH